MITCSSKKKRATEKKINENWKSYHFFLKLCVCMSLIIRKQIVYLMRFQMSYRNRINWNICKIYTLKCFLINISTHIDTKLLSLKFINLIFQLSIFVKRDSIRINDIIKQGFILTSWWLCKKLLPYVCFWFIKNEILLFFWV